MLTLHLLVEKQQKIKKRDKKLLTFTSVACVLFFLSIFITVYIKAAIYVLIPLAFVSIFLLVLHWININHLDNTKELIAKNIEHILYTEINESKNCVDAEIIFADNNQNSDEYLCFYAEGYGVNVTYNDLAVLASVLEPIVEDVNKIILQNLVIYYRIDNFPFNLSEYN